MPTESQWYGQIHYSILALLETPFIRAPLIAFSSGPQVREQHEKNMAFYSLLTKNSCNVVRLIHTHPSIHPPPHCRRPCAVQGLISWGRGSHPVPSKAIPDPGRIRVQMGSRTSPSFPLRLRMPCFPTAVWPLSENAWL
jgi:hypothetical protein